MATIHPMTGRKVRTEGQPREEQETTRAERTWSITHARAFLIGGVISVVGFWIPVLVAVNLWLSSR